jgi:AbrB family looped-hinge helix DNA binding protein
MATVTVSEKGWVVIPKEIRDRHGIKKGDKVEVVDSGGMIRIITEKEGDPIQRLRGILKGGSGTKGLLEDRRRELEREERGLPPPQPKG